MSRGTAGAVRRRTRRKQLGQGSREPPDFVIFLSIHPSLSRGRHGPGRAGWGAEGRAIRSGRVSRRLSGRRFTRFARIMSSRGFADARSRQAPPPDIKLQSTAEKRVREARAIGGTSVPPACSRASPGRVPCAVESFSGVLFQPTPRGPARGAGVRCGYGGASLFPCHLRFHPCQPRLAWPQGAPGVPKRRPGFCLRARARA